MTILNNIYRCSKCGFHAIAEEKDVHTCLELKDTRIDGDTKWVFDGIMWYPLNLRSEQPKFNNRRKRPSDQQNHILGFVFYQGVQILFKIFNSLANFICPLASS